MGCGHTEGGYECLIRLPDGGLEEAAIGIEEAHEVAQASGQTPDTDAPVDADKFRLLIEPARVRLAYAPSRWPAQRLAGPARLTSTLMRAPLD